MSHEISLRALSILAVKLRAFEVTNRPRLIRSATSIDSDYSPRVRQAAILAILDSGKVEENEVLDLFSIIKDPENHFPILGNDDNAKTNNLVLKVDAAVAIVKFALKHTTFKDIRAEFISELGSILDSMEKDELFKSLHTKLTSDKLPKRNLAEFENYYWGGFKSLLATLYIAEKELLTDETLSSHYFEKYTGLIDKKDILLGINFKEI